MQKYLVSIRGSNLWRMQNGVRQCFGFYTHVMVEALLPMDAKLLAMDLISADSSLHASTLNNPDDPVRFWPEAVRKIETIDDKHLPPKGLIFYEENANEEHSRERQRNPRVYQWRWPRITLLESVTDWILPIIGSLLTVLIAKGLGISKGWCFVLLLPGALLFQWMVIFLLAGLERIFRQRR